MIYFSFKKKLVNIILPMSLVVIIFISIFGPLSNDSISSYSQNKRFEKLLIENNMLKDGKVIKATSDVPDEDVIQISNILMYFKDNLTLKDIKSLPEDFCMEDMEDVLGIKYDSGYYDNKKNKYFNFRIDEKLNVIDIKGYDYFFNLMNLEQIDLKDKKMRLIYDDKSLVFKIYQNEEVVYHKNLEEFVEKLMERYEFNQYNDNMPLKDMLLIEENDKIKVKIVFIDISGNINESIGEIKSPRFDTNIFLKIK